MLAGEAAAEAAPSRRHRRRRDAAPEQVDEPEREAPALKRQLLPSVTHRCCPDVAPVASTSLLLAPGLKRQLKKLRPRLRCPNRGSRRDCAGADAAAPARPRLPLRLPSPNWSRSGVPVAVRDEAPPAASSTATATPSRYSNAGCRAPPRRSRPSVEPTVSSASERPIATAVIGMAMAGDRGKQRSSAVRAAMHRARWGAPNCRFAGKDRNNKGCPPRDAALQGGGKGRKVGDKGREGPCATRPRRRRPSLRPNAPAPRERDRPIDPNSPSAKLAALTRQQLVGRKD